MSALPRSRRLLVLLASVVILGLVALAITAFGVADAKTGIATIGPGPSSNTAGVKCIQRALGVTPDGRYGKDTYTAVKQFQKANNDLSVDGAVGPKTGQKLVPRAPAGCANFIPTLGSASSSAPSSAPSETAAQACHKQGKVSDGKGGCVAGVSSSAGPLVGDPSAGNPATGCVGAACTGKDPRGMRCDSDARTVTREDLVVTRSRPASDSSAVTASGDASASGNATGGAAGGATPVGGAGAGGGRASGEGKLSGSVGLENSEQHEYVDLVAGTIEVRYSPSCHAAWAKVTTKSDTPLETLTIKNDSGQSQGTAEDIRLRAVPGKNNESTPAGNYYTKLLAVSDTDQVTALAKGTRGDVDFSPNHNQSAGPVVAART